MAVTKLHILYENHVWCKSLFITRYQNPTTTLQITLKSFEITFLHFHHILSTMVTNQIKILETFISSQRARHAHFNTVAPQPPFESAYELNGVFQYP